MAQATFPSSTRKYACTGLVASSSSTEFNKLESSSAISFKKNHLNLPLRSIDNVLAVVAPRPRRPHRPVPNFPPYKVPLPPVELPEKEEEEAQEEEKLQEEEKEKEKEEGKKKALPCWIL